MTTLHVGFVFGEGYFVYGDNPASNISKYMQEETDAVKFGERLALATFQTFDKNVVNFHASEVKKVISSAERKQLDMIKLAESTVANNADTFLDNYREGIATDKEVNSSQTFVYVNGIDFE